MQLTGMVVYIALFLIVAVTANNVGYFWHITDIHWDPKYDTKENNCIRGGREVPVGRYGDHNCDAPWSLVESAVHTVNSALGDDVEFILWTGDGLTSNRGLDKMAALTNLTNLLSHKFTSHFVFPVLGHDDPEANNTSTQEPYQELASLWQHWLPEEALVTFKTGGYYSIERKQRKLRIVALNTNLCTDSVEGVDPSGQWAWLEDLLSKSRKKNETVYLVGHIGPGVDERVGGLPRPHMSVQHSDKYLSLVRRYSDIITGQFFGHLHSDTFRIVYSDEGVPVSRIFFAPSLTPRRSSSGYNNPGVRKYKIEIDTGQVLDYSQYFLDLTEANQLHVQRTSSADDEEETEIEGPEWTVLYNLTDYYGLRQSSALQLHELAEAFNTPDGLPLFVRYLQANSVYRSTGPTATHTAHSHYCALTRLEYSEYQNCLSTAAAPLAATTSAPTVPNSPAATVAPTMLMLFTTLTPLVYR
ncbi:acid sphingomyelinase-like phosphodiesterase 3b [Macrosteles quadrilineatus]|uniref:acid sphingomyelinase-like phosphodiesterase 3b n=1 Tax=Macrosteles quadrilineatus TaxID=74068 RepID=UPI0023E158F6|nr:acid sphingomyelinase-like phosphodiesterase 3b [Macrosteles quadrilineatus]